MKSTRIYGLLVGLFCLIGIVMAYQIGQREPEPSAEETLAMIIDNGGPRRVLGVTSATAYEEQMLQLVDAGLSTESVGRVYTMIAEEYMSTPARTDPDWRQKAGHYFSLALQKSTGIKERLQLIHKLAGVKQSLSDQRDVPKWPNDRREIATQLWEGLKAAKDANLPTEEPGKAVWPRELRGLDSSVVVDEEGRLMKAQKQRERERFAIESKARDDLIQAVQFRDVLENQLRDLYAINPVRLDELAELGNAIVGDAAYVERIVQKAADEYDRRYQEHLELNKHVFEKK